MHKDYKEETEKLLNKANVYFDAEDFRKAAKYFNQAGNIFFKENKYEEAKNCYSKSATSLINVSKFDFAIGALRNAGDCSLFNNQYLDAYNFFKKGLKYIQNLRKAEDQDYIYVLLSTLSYLSLFPEAKQDVGLDLVKQVKKQIDDSYFKQSPEVSLVKNLTIAVRDKNEDYLNKIETDFKKYDFNNAEKKLLKEVLALAKTHISLKITANIDKKQYTIKENIKYTLIIDSSPLLSISQNSFYDYKINKLTIESVVLETSDNITAQKKPETPISLKVGEKIELEYVLKPHFQVEKPIIGPITLHCKINDKLMFHRQDKELIIKPKIISPLPSLDVSMKALKPPLIDQTFPMEFLIENKSAGDALELELNANFPEQLKVIRGTIKKQIYSLNSNDKMTWEISLKPTEPGDYVIKMNISFKDPDQNQIQEIKEFPFSIKL